MFNQSNNNNNFAKLFSQSNNNKILTNVKKININNIESTSSSNSFDSFFIDNNCKKKNLNLQKTKKYNEAENYKLNNLLNNDISFDSFKDLTNHKNESLNCEKVNNVIKELNSQLVKMNYCNIIQSNSIRRLDLTLSFLSSQIKTLKFLNKKRKSKLQTTLKTLNHLVSKDSN